MQGHLNVKLLIRSLSELNYKQMSKQTLWDFYII